jgi:Protein of unknown function (DUF2851)
MAQLHESFLHYIWQFQRFTTLQLETTDGQKIQVIKTGFLNTDSGPDFTNARLLIGNVEWAGNVEIHVKASEWVAHKHQEDNAYENVILHVVWENNQAIQRRNGTIIPTLEIKSIVSPEVLEKYTQLIDNKGIIPCESEFKNCSELAKMSVLDKVLTQRLQSKAGVVIELFKKNKNDWEETAYQVLSKNFGFKLNAEPMLQLAQNLPLKILQKHRNNLFQIEALLFGQAGFLNKNSEDNYAQKLYEEHQFLAKKYALTEVAMNEHEWKFLRTRPANFPTIRLAQLASLVVSQASFFSLFTQTSSFTDIKKKLAVQQSDYWQTHYHFGKESSKSLKKIGVASIENVVINTGIPLLVAVAEVTDSHENMQRAVDFLEQLPPEDNHITEGWKKRGLPIKNGFDSQASIELFTAFCTQKKCFLCNVGIEILKAK